MLAVVAGTACGAGSGERAGQLEADTVRFTWGERSFTAPIIECGRDGDVVILAAERGGFVVQAAADLGEGGIDRTGVTGDMGDDDGIWGAFGAQLEPGPAGRIESVEVDGDRLLIEGRWVRFDGDLVPQPGTELDGELVARCPESEST